jgi:hypothetical protein
MLPFQLIYLLRLNNKRYFRILMYLLILKSFFFHKLQNTSAIATHQKNLQIISHLHLSKHGHDNDDERQESESAAAPSCLAVLLHLLLMLIL